MDYIYFKDVMKIDSIGGCDWYVTLVFQRDRKSSLKIMRWLINKCLL